MKSQKNEISNKMKISKKKKKNKIKSQKNEISKKKMKSKKFQNSKISGSR